MLFPYIPSLPMCPLDWNFYKAWVFPARSHKHSEKKNKQNLYSILIFWWERERMRECYTVTRHRNGYTCTSHLNGHSVQVWAGAGSGGWCIGDSVCAGLTDVDLSLRYLQCSRCNLSAGRKMHAWILCITCMNSIEIISI